MTPEPESALALELAQCRSRRSPNRKAGFQTLESPMPVERSWSIPVPEPESALKPEMQNPVRLSPEWLGC